MRMTPYYRSGAGSFGLLADDELDQVAELYRAKICLQEIDDFAHQILLKRDAVTSWELAQRQRGVACLTLGCHRIVKPIAGGDSYDVYEAQHLLSGRIDAVKVLRREAASTARITAHLRKSRAQASMNNEHIVRIYDAAYVRGVYYSVVERVRGIDLIQLMKQADRLTMGAASAMVAQAAMALDGLHAHGLVYGTVEPTKLLVDAVGHVKLCDAGAGDSPVQLNWLTTAGGRFFGFLAPEVAAGAPATAISDVYSLGCVLYYMVTANVPFPGGRGEGMRLAHRTNEPLDMRRMAGELDRAFVDLVADMMAKDAGRRIRSMAETVARIQHWVARAES